MANKPGTLSGHFTFVVVLLGFAVFALALGFKSNSDKANHRLRECVMNLEAIAAREQAVLAATGRYLSCTRYPLEVPDVDKPPTWRAECDLDHKVWTWNYESGKKRIQAEFRDGREDGVWKSWFESGHMKERGQYVEGVRSGHWTFWFDDGKRHVEKSFAEVSGQASVAAGLLCRSPLGQSGLQEENTSHLPPCTADELLLPESLISLRAAPKDELQGENNEPFSVAVSGRRTDEELIAEGAEFRWADCRRGWQCDQDQHVCWSPKAQFKKDRDPTNMETLPECWRQLMGLGRRNMVLRGQYEVSAPAIAAQGVAMQRFEATCRIDLKGDGELTEFRATESKTTWKVVGGGS